jgi:hypothetical protein
VKWLRRGSAAGAWYVGSVVGHVLQANGKLRHLIVYDGEGDDQKAHDLESDDFEWRLAPLRPLPRRSSRHAAAASYVENALECSPAGSELCVYHAALYQCLGDESSAFECASANEIEASRARLSLVLASPTEAPCSFSASAACSPHALNALTPVRIFNVTRSLAECNKASASVFDVTTDAGVQQWRVPATYRELLLSEQRDSWLDAEQRALDAILAWPGNRIVSVRVPLDAHLPIAPCVTQRKLKIDPATNRLDARKPFAARHCVDGGRLGRFLAKQNREAAETASACADDLLTKMLLAHSATSNRDLLKADVPNAYMQGVRGDRPLTYMAMPRAFSNLRGDDGEEQCVECFTPIWGEGPAGMR